MKSVERTEFECRVPVVAADSDAHSCAHFFALFWNYFLRSFRAHSSLRCSDLWHRGTREIHNLFRLASGADAKSKVLRLFFLFFLFRSRSCRLLIFTVSWKSEEFRCNRFARRRRIVALSLRDRSGFEVVSIGIGRALTAKPTAKVREKSHYVFSSLLRWLRS